MIYACRRCRFEEARGCVPTVSCGMLLAVLWGIATVPLSLVVLWLFPEGLGWWWLIAGPLVWLVALPLGLLLHPVLAACEWLAFCWRRCPQCSAHAWSWGFTRGFGM